MLSSEVDEVGSKLCHFRHGSTNCTAHLLQERVPVAVVVFDVRGQHGFNYPNRSLCRISLRVVRCSVQDLHFILLAEFLKQLAPELNTIVANKILRRSE